MNLLEYLKDKNVFFVSDADLDGISARVIAEYYLNPIATVVYLNTFKRDMSEFDINIAMNADVIIFVDITPTLELYNQLTEYKKPIIMFDHHETAKEILGDRLDYYYDNTKCGTKIFYEKLVENMRRNRVVERYVELVNTYDLYHTETDNWKEAKDLHNTMYGYVNWRKRNYETDTERYIRFIQAQINKFNIYDNFRFTIEEIKTIERATKSEQKSYKEAKKSLRLRTDNEGNQYGYFSCTSKLSFIANRLLKEYPDKVQYLVCFSTWEKDNMNLSIRSSKGFSIRHIAEKHGGGGHPQAAGIEFKDKQILQDIQSGKNHLI